jgi:hypothetical protein
LVQLAQLHEGGQVRCSSAAKKSSSGLAVFVSLRSAKASQKFPGITFLDEADIFADCDDSEALYTRSHHSPKTNRMIADYLNRNL